MPDAPLPPGNFLFASESVTEGQPDKLCDRVAEAVLDACLSQDPDAHVSCEACTKTGMVMILGEITTKANVNYEQVIREAVKALGYDSDDKGLDWRTMNVIVAIEEQSPDLAQAVSGNKAGDDAGPADPGIVFGYATNETPEMMPLSHVLATKICCQLDKVRKEGTVAWARPNGRAQVTVEYKESPDGAIAPVRVHTVAVSAQSAADTKPEQIEKDLMEHVVKPALPEALCDANTVYQLVPSKLALLGSQHSDSGMSGRKIVVDTYGGWGSHGGGSLSGKDGAKVSRSATYAARWAARSLVHAKVCKRCLVQLSYSASSAQPTSVHVYSYGTSKACGKTDGELAEILKRSFDLRPGCLKKELGLTGAQFQKLAAYGHLGRTDVDLAWEKPKDLK
eukprot:gnl/TRDRNA2_/TRDRNA2_191874_c0_seq1.p1 gnl/TRDRNA2_/TRDRNA2_191874_c0~~gnl/TRDRNA2_/TRDRNA2_191874_c0_seq1.p1  ORF type:complete len:394 (+),score=83.50 gnl/TRDRNA2_/TRDRNA2_191874_c0_seq1:65-1246(+)